MSITRTVTLTVNGEARIAPVDVRLTLADLLRDHLRLTGTHVGCEQGVCGACNVLVDGVAVRSCLMLAVQATGREIVTIEGLAQGDVLHPVQQAFYECHSFQCGFCTPGFVMTTVELLADDPTVDEAGIREALSGNICRCTGYESIIDGVRLAAERLTTDPA
jgi:aerobic-type carbon monoxide dehydrogenase small subunit (CoxS/CutS family)